MTRMVMAQWHDIMIDWESLKVREGAYLPHWTCDGAIYHVVFRLADSLPKTVLESWCREREAIIETAECVSKV